MDGTIHVLLAGGPSGRMPAWSGPGLQIDALDDLGRLPFQAARGYDVVVCDRPLPPGLGPIPIPLISLRAVPADPARARRLLARLAGRPAAAPASRLAAETGHFAMGPAPRLSLELLPDLELDRLRRVLLPDLQREAQMLRSGCRALVALNAANGTDPLEAIRARRAAWRPRPPHGEGPAASPRILRPVRRAEAVTTTGQAVVVLVGPADGMLEIEALTDALETLPDLHIHFRLFRAGLFRLDAHCRDIDGLQRWLLDRPDVASVLRDGETLHVLPATGLPAPGEAIT